MRNKLMFMVLFSFAVAACENIVDDGNGNGTGKDNHLMLTMQDMSKSIANVKATNDPDQDFAVKMRIHHKGAIDMANYELLRGDDKEVKDFADSIVKAHTLEIAQLDSFLNSHTVKVDSVNGKEFLNESKQAIAKMDSLIKVRSLNGDVDHNFLVLVIEHHRSGVELADAEISSGQDAGLKALVTKLRQGAVGEIGQLQALLNKNYSGNSNGNSSGNSNQ
jgi:uncharacterized protein (DUF305 family)